MKTFSEYLKLREAGEDFNSILKNTRQQSMQGIKQRSPEKVAEYEKSKVELAQKEKEKQQAIQDEFKNKLVSMGLKYPKES